MPGIIVFQRRWGVGSDDLVVPGISLTLIHAICLVLRSRKTNGLDKPINLPVLCGKKGGA
ncbi:hypothetical protein OUZ56_007459 [Daphnia magna]|uniref:Uncharacterized protein n=1 Tax=Daphnia magna TaxID=35525 RepID=A0ABR0AA10_9CRUS|nr:hypothetical protein OUZ56_007459 [Daphnia magna]